MTDQGAITFGSSLSAGTVNEGAPTVQIYYDYLCVHCNDLEREHGAELSKLAEDGKITLELHPVGMMDEFLSCCDRSFLPHCRERPRAGICFQ